MSVMDPFVTKTRGRIMVAPYSGGRKKAFISRLAAMVVPAPTKKPPHTGPSGLYPVRASCSPLMNRRISSTVRVLPKTVSWKYQMRSRPRLSVTLNTPSVGSARSRVRPLRSLSR